MVQQFELIVIGGGTAGCVVAARASEDPRRTVLLIEAGPDPVPAPKLVSDPGRQPELLRDGTFIRRYPVERANGSTLSLISGRIMGGGSSVNNAAVARPMARDFAAWTRYGGSRWSYDALLPLMREIEDDPDFPDSPIHGTGGPLHLHRDFKLGEQMDPPVRALVEAADDLGLPPCDDLNGPAPFGTCSSPYNVMDGVRQSTSVAYLDPARARPNLTIRSDTTAARLRVSAGRVTGVELIGPGGPETVSGSEVVLAAGVFHTPQVLMLSGIGSPAEIEPIGIEPMHPLEGVGRNYQDHAVVYARFTATRRLRQEYAMPKIRLVAKSNEALDHPDLHLIVHTPVRHDGQPPTLPVSVRLLDHRSTGRVRLASADPTALPLVEPKLLSHDADLTAMVDGIGMVRRLATHPALANFYGSMVEPAAHIALSEHVLASYDSYHHGTGTCRIGPGEDSLAVVDEHLRVHGLDNLRIADASVLPTIPHANTNLAAILVGEIAAREICQG